MPTSSHRFNSLASLVARAEPSRADMAAAQLQALQDGQASYLLHRRMPAQYRPGAERASYLAGFACERRDLLDAVAAYADEDLRLANSTNQQKGNK